jgi:hypothetical protein
MPQSVESTLFAQEYMFWPEVLLHDQSVAAQEDHRVKPHP